MTLQEIRDKNPTHVTLNTEITFPYSGVTLRPRKKYPVRVYTCVQVEYAPMQWLIVHEKYIHRLYSETQP